MNNHYHRQLNQRHYQYTTSVIKRSQAKKKHFQDKFSSVSEDIYFAFCVLGWVFMNFFHLLSYSPLLPHSSSSSALFYFPPVNFILIVSILLFSKLQATFVDFPHWTDVTTECWTERLNYFFSCCFHCVSVGQTNERGARMDMSIMTSKLF